MKKYLFIVLLAEGWSYAQVALPTFQGLHKFNSSSNLTGAAVFTTSGNVPNCWCSQQTTTTTVTTAGWAKVVTSSSTSTASCRSCKPYTTETMWLDVGTYTMTSQASPCTCSASSLVLNGIYAVEGVENP